MLSLRQPALLIRTSMRSAAATVTHLACVQGTCQGSLINDTTAGNVDDARTPLDLGEHLIVEQVLGGGQQGHVEGEEVALLRAQARVMLRGVRGRG